MLAPGSIANTDDIIALSLRLFEEKQRQAEAEAAASGKSKKWAFLRSILTNQDLARNPELVDFALSDPLLSLVTNYLGTIPHLNRIDLLYSVNHGGEEAISSQIYHLDPEGTRQAKLFMNLRDVGPDEGPFTFIPAAETTRIVNTIKKQRLADVGDGGRTLSQMTSWRRWAGSRRRSAWRAEGKRRAGGHVTMPALRQPREAGHLPAVPLHPVLHVARAWEHVRRLAVRERSCAVSGDWSTARACRRTPCRRRIRWAEPSMIMSDE